jgi:hypothetical protein
VGVLNGSAGVVEVLLIAGADTTLQDDRRRTAMACATREGDVTLIALFRKHAYRTCTGYEVDERYGRNHRAYRSCRSCGRNKAEHDSFRELYDMSMLYPRPSERFDEGRVSSWGLAIGGGGGVGGGGVGGVDGQDRKDAGDDSDTSSCVEADDNTSSLRTSTYVLP